MARLALSILALVTLLSASPAVADEPAPRAPRPAPSVVHLGEIVVPGWIHNPGVVFILERTRPRFSPTPLRRSFVPDLLRTPRDL